MVIKLVTAEDGTVYAVDPEVETTVVIEKSGGDDLPIVSPHWPETVAGTGDDFGGKGGAQSHIPRDDNGDHQCSRTFGRPTRIDPVKLIGTLADRLESRQALALFCPNRYEQHDCSRKGWTYASKRAVVG